MLRVGQYVKSSRAFLCFCATLTGSCVYPTYTVDHNSSAGGVGNGGSSASSIATSGGMTSTIGGAATGGRSNALAGAGNGGASANSIATVGGMTNTIGGAATGGGGAAHVSGGSGNGATTASSNVAPTGGMQGNGGATTGSGFVGGSSNTGGSSNVGAGGSSVGTGGFATGVSTDGVSTGGVSTGGVATGGTTTGVAATGGTTTGVAATGGVATGGVTSGGAATGGVATGGVATGDTTISGAATGGAATGGVATGGSSTVPVVCPSDPNAPVMVSVPGGYCIDSTEVTRNQYSTWIASISNMEGAIQGQPSACSFNLDYAPDSTCLQTATCQQNCGQHPAICVDWCDAYAFCKAHGRRLCGNVHGGANVWAYWENPDQSQWYAACSSGEQNRNFVYGDSFDASICQSPTVNGDDTQTAEVASHLECQSKNPSYAGVYDLNGNVWEWEDACYGDTGEWDACSLRGGSYLHYELPYDPLKFDTCTHQGVNQRKYVRESVGFRCCT